MTTRSRLFLLGCWVMACVNSVPLPAQQAGQYDPLVAQLRRIISRELESKQVPALSIALVDGDRIVWAEGFGTADAAHGVAASADTIYRVGSISKLLTDLAVMRLVEQGTLDLDADIRTYLPDFAPRNLYNTPLTLRLLMSHRSGLVRESPVGNYFDPTDPTLAETVRSLNDTALIYAPETRTKYSNAAIAVAGYVLEKVTGVPFAKHMREEVLRPVGMASSDYEATAAVRDKLAEGWMWTVDGRRFLAPTFGLGTSPAGNLYSSVNDLARFMLVLFADGAEPNGKSLLQVETLRRMMDGRPFADGQPPQFGIGFALGDLDGHRVIEHGGAVYGFATQFKALPDDKLGVICVASLDGANGLTKRLSDFALRGLLALRAQAPLPEWPETQPVPPALTKLLAGRYQQGGKTLELTELGGKLHLHRDYTIKEVRALGDKLVVDDVQGYGPEFAVKSPDGLRFGDDVWKRIADEKPSACPEKWAGLIGEYGWDHNTLYIYEDRGRLRSLIEWFYDYALTELSENEFAFPNEGLYHGEKLIFRRDEAGRAKNVVAADVLFERRHVGTEEGTTFRITPLKPVDELRAMALAADPPAQPADLRAPDLVDLTTLDPAITLDIRYASTNNFLGVPFYKQARAFLQRPAAEAVLRAHKALAPEGYGLLIHDAYRPWHVTKMFWEATPEKDRIFVADPSKGSRHNRGCAVDLTLYRLSDGRPVRTPSGYDEFSSRAFPAYPGGTSLERWHRELLRTAMEREGFSVFPLEWWHFDYQDWEQYPVLDRTFEELDLPRDP